RWFLDATPLDLPATVQGSFPQTYDVALKAGLLYRFDANSGSIEINCLDWHSYYNTNQWDALQVRPAKDEDCVLSVQNASPEGFTLSAKQVPENPAQSMANAAPITPGDLSEEFSESDQSHWYKFSAIAD